MGIQVEGFTISGANGTSGNSIIVNGHSIKNNTGAGIILNEGKNVIRNNHFRDNAATYGGGIGTNNGKNLISGNILNSNTAFGGGGINTEGGMDSICNNVIINNDNIFGAIRNNGSNTTIFNNTFFGNSGAAIRLLGGSHELRNNIMWSNDIDSVTTSGTTTFTLSHSIIQDGDPRCVNCPGTDGNIYPLFRDTLDLDGVDNIFGTEDDGISIGTSSPAIDASDPSTQLPLTDISGYSRDEIFDIGAYEYHFLNIGPFMIVSSGIHYATILDAVNASMSGDTIMQVADATESAPMTIPLGINFVTMLPYVLLITP